MFDLLADILDFCRLRGAEHADARMGVVRTESIVTRNGMLASLDRGEHVGLGVRVLVDGAWGFASVAAPDRAAAFAAAERALDIAAASARVVKAGVQLAAEPAYVDFWQSPRTIDPFRVSLETKLDILFAADAIMRREPLVQSAVGNMAFEHERQWYADTAGARIEQDLLRSGAGISAEAVGHGDKQIRSWPASFGGQYKQTGFELVQALDLPGNAARIAAEAAALLTAPELTPGRRDLILHPSQMMLQIHESVGHATELDRVLGFEADYAGTSFLKPEMLSRKRYGSELVNLVADNTVPTGLATAGYDDDGVAAQRWYIVRDGILTGFMTNRETAHAAGEARSRGCNRAEGPLNIPIVRIANLSLLPGTTPLEELFASTDDGVYMDVNKCWSIDQQRLNFQFGCEIAWEIKNGRRGRMLKNPTYQGITPEFWAACDAIADADDWDLWGVINCGKGRPGQRAEMSHGSSHARFRDVMTGVR